MKKRLMSITSIALITAMCLSACASKPADSGSAAPAGDGAGKD